MCTVGVVVKFRLMLTTNVLHYTKSDYSILARYCIATTVNTEGPKKMYTHLYASLYAQLELNYAGNV